MLPVCVLWTEARHIEIGISLSFFLIITIECKNSVAVLGANFSKEGEKVF